jgi:hypothetical protein
MFADPGPPPPPSGPPPRRGAIPFDLRPGAVNAVDGIEVGPGDRLLMTDIDFGVVEAMQVRTWEGVRFVEERAPRRLMLADDLARIVEPALAGYIAQARRRGRTPAPLVRTRTQARRRRLAVEIICDFDDDWHISIELPDRLEGSLGQDPRSRALASEVCQRVYAALLDRQSARDVRRQAFETMRESFSQRWDSAMREALFGPPVATATNARRDAEPSLTVENIERAMRELEQEPIERRSIRQAFNEFAVYGAAFAPPPPREPVFHTPAAEARGLELLKANLTPAQLAQYERRAAFDLTGSVSGKRYRIRHGRQYNVDELDSRGEIARTLCFVPQGELVTGDILLAQKIALETDEAAALAVANVDTGTCPCVACRDLRQQRAAHWARA